MGRPSLPRDWVWRGPAYAVFDPDEWAEQVLGKPRPENWRKWLCKSVHYVAWCMIVDRGFIRVYGDVPAAVVSACIADRQESVGVT